MEPAAEDIALGAEATTPVTLNRLWETATRARPTISCRAPARASKGFRRSARRSASSIEWGSPIRPRSNSFTPSATRRHWSRTSQTGWCSSTSTRARSKPCSARAARTSLETLREELRKDLDLHKAGIDIVSVLIEEVHPPAGAAAAYHAVQAAEINASASIFDEVGNSQAHRGRSGAGGLPAHVGRRSDGLRDHSARPPAKRIASRPIAGANKSPAPDAFLLERYYGKPRGQRSPIHSFYDHRPSAEARTKGRSSTCAPFPARRAPSPRGLRKPARRRAAPRRYLRSSPAPRAIARATLGFFHYPLDRLAARMFSHHDTPGGDDHHDHDKLGFSLRIGVAALVLLAAVAAACIVMVPAGEAGVITRFGNPNRVITRSRPRLEDACADREHDSDRPAAANDVHRPAGRRHARWVARLGSSVRRLAGAERSATRPAILALRAQSARRSRAPAAQLRQRRDAHHLQ